MARGEPFIAQAPIDVVNNSDMHIQSGSVRPVTLLHYVIEGFEHPTAGSAFPLLLWPPPCRSGPEWQCVDPELYATDEVSARQEPRRLAEPPMCLFVLVGFTKTVPVNRLVQLVAPIGGNIFCAVENSSLNRQLLVRLVNLGCNKGVGCRSLVKIWQTDVSQPQLSEQRSLSTDRWNTQPALGYRRVEERSWPIESFCPF